MIEGLIIQRKLPRLVWIKTSQVKQECCLIASKCYVNCSMQALKNISAYSDGATKIEESHPGKA